MMRPVPFLEYHKWNYISPFRRVTLFTGKGEYAMTYQEAKVYVEYIKVLLEKEGLTDDTLKEALNAAMQALDYEPLSIELPTNFPMNLTKGRKIAVYCGS